MRTPARLLAVGAAFLVTMALAAPATAAITTSASASDLAGSMAAVPTVVTGASFVTTTESGTPTATSDTALASFPTDGSSYAILTSGDAGLADDPNDGGSNGADNNGPSVRGDTDLDVTILKVDLAVPPTQNCLSIDFRFLSEEFPEYVTEGNFNDAFIAELDSSTWSTSGSSITAPNNFAFDPSGNVISVKASGVADMSATHATGTTYDGGTPLLRASTQVTSGAHSLYLSIFDQGDQAYDSAVFVDNLALGTTSEEECQPGAELVAPEITKSADQRTSVAGGTNGYTITVDNPNESALTLTSISDTLPSGFTYKAGSTTGMTMVDPTVAGSTLTWDDLDPVPASGEATLSFDVTVSGTAGDYFNNASATADDLTIAPTGDTAPILVIGPPTITKLATEGSVAAGEPVRYSIAVQNDNPSAISVELVTDTLPPGFSYLPGSTDGATSADPTVTGQTLTWDGPFEIDANDTLSLGLTAISSGAPGTYVNQASALATGFSLVSTTAPVISLGDCLSPSVPGTRFGETLRGTGAPDVVSGLGGRDLVDGLEGDDRVCGGPAGDYVYGRHGADQIVGEDGPDRLFGGKHSDAIVGGPGRDAMSGGKGADVIDAQDGEKDCILTGPGHDEVHADSGLDLVDPKRGCRPGF